MRVAETPPAFCSACFGQYPDRRHVDFDVAWDGPTVPGGVMTPEGVQSGITVTIDDMVVCDGCLTAAGRLVGLEPAGETVAKLDQALAEAAVLRERLAGQADYIGKLEAAQAARLPVSSGSSRSTSP